MTCLILGQNEQEIVVDSETAATSFMMLVLDPDVGRRTEQAIRLILEGQAAEQMKLDALKNPEVDRRITKGAVR
jgi:hypothetical protein